MLRTILLTLLNLALPYLIYALWQGLLKLHKTHRARKNQPPIIDITPLPHWPRYKLLACGVVLLALSLLVLRWHENPAEPLAWRPANPAHNVAY